MVDRSDSADIVIVNTCAFINPAKEESLEEILTLAQEKKKGNRQFKLVVAGCLAQRYGKELSAQIPEVDLFIGTGEVGNIARHINKLDEIKCRRASCNYQTGFLDDISTPAVFTFNNCKRLFKNFRWLFQLLFLLRNTFYSRQSAQPCAGRYSTRSPEFSSKRHQRNHYYRSGYDRLRRGFKKSPAIIRPVKGHGANSKALNGFACFMLIRHISLPPFWKQ